MDFFRSVVGGAVAIFLATSALAATNPISWSQSGTLPATAELNQSYTINFTLTSHLPFTMPTPLEISNNSTPASEVTMVDGCSGLRLTPNQTCNVALVLIPKSAGTKQLSIYMEYGKNKVQVPTRALTTNVIDRSGSQLQSVVAPAFPTSILSNTTYALSFTFSNTGQTALSGLSLAPSLNNTAGYTQSTSNCGATLAAGASCTVTGSFTTANTSGIVSVGYTYGSSTISTSPITTTVINNSTGQGVRTFTIENKCNQTVWFGFVGGAVNDNPCTSNADCAHGSTCDPTANQGAGACFYNNPVPANGTYQLAQNATNTVTITDFNLQYVWSGNIAARTGSNCANGVCDTADCGSGGGVNACPVGRGFDQPATLAEFTLQRATVDSYDISILNGTNVGTQILPTTNFTFNPNGISPPAYNCQSPGKVAPVPGLGLGGCDWNGFTPPAFPNSDSASSYKYVLPPTSSPTPCTDDTPCTTPPYSTCGLNFNKTNQTLSKVCGQLIGYNTANQVCSFANTNQNVPNAGNNPGNPYFPCDSAITGGTGQLASFTNWAMYACKAQANGDLGTCYNTAANPPASTPNCCGCVDWQNVPGVTVPAGTTTCVNFNSSWTNLITPFNGYVLQTVQWMKEACPTAYVYPFDDKSSGFACMDISSSHTVNTVNYTITFCPT